MEREREKERETERKVEVERSETLYDTREEDTLSRDEDKGRYKIQRPVETTRTRRSAGRIEKGWASQARGATSTQHTGLSCREDLPKDGMASRIFSMLIRTICVCRYLAIVSFEAHVSMYHFPCHNDRHKPRGSAALIGR